MPLTVPEVWQRTLPLDVGTGRRPGQPMVAIGAVILGRVDIVIRPYGGWTDDHPPRARVVVCSGA